MYPAHNSSEMITKQAKEGIRVVLVGLRRPGIVEKLLELGANLTIIESDEELCRAVSTKFPVRVYKGRGDDLNVLKRAGADKADMLVAATNNDYSNLMVCRYAKIKLNIPHVIAIINDRRKKAAFQEIRPELDAVIYFIGEQPHQ